MKPVEAQDGLQRWASCVRGAGTCVGIMCAHLQGVMVWVSQGAVCLTADSDSHVSVFDLRGGRSRVA